ncbi:MAG: tripartite tricarboxylate transporter TctB family protein [Fusobacteriaceae bacterium]
MLKADRIFSVILGVISIIIFYLSSNFESGFIIDSGLGADFFPKSVSIILFILSSILFFKSFSTKEYSKGIFSKNSKILGITLCYFFVYIVLINIIGYLLATILFLIGMFKFLKIKSNKFILFYSLIFSILIWYIFNNIFNINLPIGTIYY